jgi:hypothetical protein
MFACWPVKDVHLEFLTKHTDVEIDLSTFDYFVETDAAPLSG